MALLINIAKDFAPVPLGRYKTDGDKSGQVFREKLLFPKIRTALAKNDTLKVDFTGMYGVHSSFLEEAFGGLVRNHGLNPEDVLKTIVFLPEKSHFDLYINLTKKYIREAKPEVGDV